MIVVALTDFVMLAIQNSASLAIGCCLAMFFIPAASCQITCPSLIAKVTIPAACFCSMAFSIAVWMELSLP